MAQLTKPDISRHRLSLEQQNAVDLLVTGQSDREVAAAVGVSRQTVCGWRMHHPTFQAALNRRRRETWGMAVESLRAMLPRAVERVGNELDGPNGWKVGLRLLELSGLAGRDKDYGSVGIGLTDGDAIIEAEARSVRDPLYLVDFDAVEGGPITDAEREAALARLLERANSAA